MNHKSLVALILCVIPLGGYIYLHRPPTEKIVEVTKEVKVPGLVKTEYIYKCDASLDAKGNIEEVNHPHRTIFGATIQQMEKINPGYTNVQTESDIMQNCWTKWEYGDKAYIMFRNGRVVDWNSANSDGKSAVWSMMDKSDFDNNPDRRFTK